MSAPLFEATARVITAMKAALGKSIYRETGKGAWTEANETEYQRAMAALVAAARAGGIQSFKMIQTTPQGLRIGRDLSIDRIFEHRELQ